MDFKKLFEVFVEEAMEHIENLEEGLLQLEKSPDDAELLNSIFRAAHTIKGSSGSLGLKDISRFTHIKEEILDAMRNGEIVPDKELISILLEGVDLLKEMVAAVSEEIVFDFNRCSGVMKRIKELLEARRTSDPAYSDSASTSRSAPDRGCIGGGRMTYMIVFRPAADLFRRGINPAMILEDLRSLGDVFDIRTHTDDIPFLSEIDPESVYIRWDLKLETDHDESAIREKFAFVEDGSEILISPIKACTGEIPLVGQLLVENNVVSREDVEEALKEQKKLGQILVGKGKTTEYEIEKILEKQNAQKAESFKKSISSSIRVDLKKLDNLVNLVGEMVIIHSMFQQTLSGGRVQSNVVSASAAERCDAIFSQLQRIGRDIQESTMALRMLSVGDVFQRFVRLVRELSSSKGKNVDLVISGEETELDKGVLERIADPLVHLIRNAIDHGIETPDERQAAGKSARATVFLRAYQQGDAVYIDVEDDGRGLNKDRIVKKALEKGILSDAAGLTDEQVYSIIFLPGFSTAEKVTDVSGRGVGMDVVKKNIETFNGSVSIKSRKGLGVTISIRLPLTLAIIDGLTVRVGSESFIIPITSVVESIRPSGRAVNTIEGKGEVVDVRGEYIPLIRLYELLNMESLKKIPSEAIVVVTQYRDNRFGLMVDDLVGEQQVVLKNLGKATPKVKNIAGGTILGDGRVALVLDVAGIVEMSTN
ncbi:MAG: chemotaxis protein CheA [Nitrospirae bacterium]|nr:chemotaxis protein CheA [Nitrospirota bacterium]